MKCLPFQPYCNHCYMINEIKWILLCKKYSKIILHGHYWFVFKLVRNAICRLMKITSKHISINCETRHQLRNLHELKSLTHFFLFFVFLFVCVFIKLNFLNISNCIKSFNVILCLFIRSYNSRKEVWIGERTQ